MRPVSERSSPWVIARPSSADTMQSLSGWRCVARSIQSRRHCAPTPGSCILLPGKIPLRNGRSVARDGPNRASAQVYAAVLQPAQWPQRFHSHISSGETHVQAAAPAVVLDDQVATIELEFRGAVIWRYTAAGR